MKRMTVFTLCALFAGAFLMMFQPTASHAQEDTSKLSAVDKEASQLEAQLGKVLDTSLAGGEVMLKLVDLYHANGRVFGLIRVGQKFVVAHPSHTKHGDVMVKLIEGLAAMSRNADLIATSRQFLARYSKHGAARQMQRTLAETLDQTNDRKRAANAWAALWQRDRNGERAAGARAVYLYTALNNNASFKLGSELAKQMLDHLPKGTFGAEIGWQGVNLARRVSDFGGSNAMAATMIKKGMPMDKQRLAGLYKLIAENYSSMGQHTNAVANYAKARQQIDTPETHRKHVEMMYGASMKAGQIEPVVNQYMAKYKTRDDRWYVFGFLANAYSRDGDKPHAVRLYEQMLPHDASTHDVANSLIHNIGDKPADYKRAEQILIKALSTNKKDTANIRYALAFALYRDRLKDEGKAKAQLRELMAKTPFNNGRSWEAIRHLLYKAKDDAEFNKDAKLLVESATRFGNLNYVRYYVANWVKEARNNKAYRGKAAALQQMMKAAANVQLYRNWVAATSGKRSSAVEARDWLLKSPDAKKMNDQQIRWLLRTQGEYYQHYTNKDKSQSIRYFAAAAKKYSKDYDAARALLNAAVSYGSTKEAKAASLHLLTFDPPSSDHSSWRLMLIVATKEKNLDAALGKKVFDYINKSESKHGKSLGYAGEIGRALEKLGMKDQALAYWKSHWKENPSDTYSHECVREIASRADDAARIALYTEAYKISSGYQGAYAAYLADLYFQSAKWSQFDQILRDSRKRKDEQPFSSWGMGEYPAWNWMSALRDTNSKIPVETKQFAWTAIRDLRLGRVSSAAALSILEVDDAGTPMKRLLAYRDATIAAGDSSGPWDSLFPYAQAAAARKEYLASATLGAGMLANIGGIDKGRQQQVRALIGQSYARLGSVGMAIDDDSPVAPLLQAALYLRLGDEVLAFETYVENAKLFDKHRELLPIELILFVAESHIAAGGDENFNRAEDILRTWLVKFAESKTVEISTKAQVQLLLGKNYFASKRYDVARSEFKSVINRFPKTEQALDAEFGIGETYMAQKMYDEAEKIFEKLANAREREVVIRAEFLRGVLAHRRGDREEARDIFRSVLDRVPDLGLANQTLFNLSQVYGEEQRYIEQLELLNTVGRLGRRSKRWHTPGATLSIVVQDSDLGISRGHTRIPVIVTTVPGGDQEMIYLYSGGAGKGLFRGDLATSLGSVKANDKTLQLTGNDTVKCDYPDTFKKDFRNIPLADAEIRIAADAKFEVASSKIVDVKKETFSQRLAKEAMMKGEDQDQRVSQKRPQNQIKPGNLVYTRVKDADRDLTDQPDNVIVKLVATSGDQVQVELTETSAHSGVFEGTANTGELPAGALASDHSIDRNPLMAIDQSEETYWESEPDGATPKWLSVDMKDLRRISSVTMTSPDPTNKRAVRTELQGSHDGRFWFRVASHPPAKVAAKLATKAGPMTVRVYQNRYHQYKTWDDVVRMTKSREPVTTEKVEQLEWNKPEGDDSKNAYTVIWQGRFVQPRPGAVRFAPTGGQTAVIVNGVEELALDVKAGRSVDVWLDRGVHELVVVGSMERTVKNGTIQCLRARENPNAEQIRSAPFRASDYDLSHPDLKAAIEDGRITAPAKPIVLLSTEAKLTKKTKEFGPFKGQEGLPLANWRDAEDIASWEVKVDRAGPVALWMNWSHQGAGSECVVTLGDQTVELKVPDTGAWTKFVNQQVATFRINKPGTYTVSIKPKKIENGGLMDLRSATLRPSTDATTIDENGKWHFEFLPHEIRYVRFMVHEYTGESVAINHVEVSGDSDGGENIKYIPTKADVLALASNDTLEIAAGDTVTASYTDEFVFTSAAQDDAARNRVLSEQMQATYFNAKINPIRYEFSQSGGGGVGTSRKDLMRIDPGERIIIEVVDYDNDTTNKPDQITVLVSVNDAPPIEMTATETGEYTGVFTKEVDTAGVGTEKGKPADANAEAKTGADAAPPSDEKIVVKQGDRVYIRYIDRQNTFPGHSITREQVVYVNEPTDGLVRIIETRYIQPPVDENGVVKGAGQVLYLDARPSTSSIAPVSPMPKAPASEVAAGVDPVTADPADETVAASKPVEGDAGKVEGPSGVAIPDGPVTPVAFEVPLTVEVIDPDQAKDSGSSVIVEVTTTDGVKIPVRCVISASFGSANAALDYEDSRSGALREGRFVGQVIMQLGGKNSPQIVPITVDMPKGVVGGPLPIDETPDDDEAAEPLPQGVARVLNLTGKDRVASIYKDERRAQGGAQTLSAHARLVSNATLALTNRDYNKAVEKLHVGEKLFMRVTDADADISDERDTVTVVVTTERGEQETIQLQETLAHSGDFTGSVVLKAQEKPTAGNMLVDSPEIESFFGDIVSVKFVDEAASTETGTLELQVDVPIVIGTNGLVKAFSKIFGDEKLAVETRFTIAESYFELFKSHKKLTRDDEMKADLEAGKRVLREVVEDYPDPKYVPRIQYLYGQFAQELEQWDEAIEAYSIIVRQHPEHSLAPDAQYKLAQSHEESGNFDEALEAYVTLAATYPRNPLIAKVMVRINEYFFKNEEFQIAANVAEKFLVKFENHEYAPRMAFRIGQAYYKAENFKKAAVAFDIFTKDFPDEELAALAYFWAGESFRMSKNVPEAFRRYNFCRWKHPESEAAKYSRGRLALPEMLAQFEKEAQVEE